MNITDIIRNNTVRFIRLRQGVAYYAVSTIEGEREFPVPLSDIGDATLEATEKAILFMRYIRKAREDGAFVPA